MDKRELNRRIADFDDGGAPGWRARHTVINAKPSRRSFGRMMAGPKWDRWPPARRLVWWFFLPWNFTFGVIGGVVVGVVVLELLGVLH